VNTDHIYIIAEAGVNHNGDVDVAIQLIDKAAEAGADAVKFQMFDADELTGEDAPLAEYQKHSGQTSQREMLHALTLTEDDFTKLSNYTKQKEIDFIVTPFDTNSAQFLASLNVPAIKIPSGEITHLSFLEKVATLGIPVILSTGTCNLEEVDDAVQIFKAAGIDLSILHCTSSYPAPYDQINLRVMDTLSKKFGVPVGLSDHSEGITVPIAAAALGAKIIEKHFTLDRTMDGPDHKASLEPHELTAMIEGIRQAESALGSSEKVIQPAEANTASVARRSTVAVQDIAAGEKLSTENTALKRPGTGIPPKEYESVMQKTAQENIAAGTPITHDMLT
jgi:N-acetylneuraminate synthase